MTLCELIFSGPRLRALFGYDDKTAVLNCVKDFPKFPLKGRFQYDADFGKLSAVKPRWLIGPEISIDGPMSLFP